MNNKEKKRKAHLITLVLIAVYLSLLETLIPKPFPWMKIGLANLSVLIALINFDKKMALEVFVMRVLAQNIMLGTLLSPSFFISFISGLSSTLFMLLLFSYKKYFSVIAISIASGILHNSMQLLVVYLLLFRNIEIYTRSILSFILIFLVMGSISGGITGFIAHKYVEKKEKFGGLGNGKKILWNRWRKRGSE